MASSDVQAKPAVAERAGPRARQLAPRLRLPRPSRLHRRLRLRLRVSPRCLHLHHPFRRRHPQPSLHFRGIAADVLAFARTLASLLALNPFARLSAADLAGPTPSWSLAFLGPPGSASYSWPPTPTQARLRVQENVRRYTRNYVALSILVFACCLYVLCAIRLLPLISILKAAT